MTVEPQSATGVGRGSESTIGFGRWAVIETGIGLCVTIELDVDAASTPDLRRRARVCLRRQSEIEEAFLNSFWQVLSL